MPRTNADRRSILLRSFRSLSERLSSSGIIGSGAPSCWAGAAEQVRRGTGSASGESLTAKALAPAFDCVGQGGGVEELFKTIAGNVALGAELIATLLIAIGGIGALTRVIRMLAERNAHVRTIKDIWLRLAGWILLALEFTLA